MWLLSRKICDVDLVEDVRAQYIDALRRGKDGIEATSQLVADYESALLDGEDAPRFWFALAEVQWALGRLEEAVKRNALACIEKQLEYAGTQAGDVLCADLSANVLMQLEQKLLSPQPQQKKIKPYHLYYTDWKMGDVFSYRLNCEDTDHPDFHNRYVYFAVKGTEIWWPGHLIPVVYVYWIVSKELLGLERLQEIAFLPQFYQPVAYQNHPGMKRLYALAMLCTSARVIPKKKLIYLGNVGSVQAVDNEQPEAYPMAWKRFDQYMIENYMAWENRSIC